MARFEEAYWGGTESRLTQEDAARVLGVCARTFRRWLDRYEEAGLDGGLDKRLSQASGRGAPVEEGRALVARYRTGYRGGHVRPLHAWDRRDGGGRRDTGGKNRLPAAGLVPRAPRRGGTARVARRRHGRGCGCTRTGAVTSGGRGSGGI